MLGDRELDRPRELLAHGRAHAAAEIRELEGGHHDRKAAHPADAGDDSLRRAGLLARRPHTVAVPLRVLEAERIGRHDAAVALLERAVVDELGDALMRGDPERVATLRTHATRPLHLGAVHDLLAGVALDPQALGDDDLLALRLGRLVLATEPDHWSAPRRAQRRLERSDEVPDLRHERGPGGVLLDHAHDRRADDDAIGQ